MVSILADLVTGQATRLSGHQLALLERRRNLGLDLGRRAGVGTEEGQVSHRDDHKESADRSDRTAGEPALGRAIVERQQEQQHHA